MQRILVIICFLLFYNTVCAQKKIVVQKAYCIDEALSLSKENEIDRILCSGGCDMRLYFVINISGKIDEFIDSEAPCLSPSMFIKMFSIVTQWFNKKSTRFFSKPHQGHEA